MLHFGKLGLRFLGSFQFLTVIPIHRSTAPPNEAALFFPLVGAFIGGVSSLPLLVEGVDRGLLAALSLVVQLCLTGMLHEDGLADVADALRAGRSKEKMFEILKDSRIGTYGACALVAALLMRWQGMVHATHPSSALVASETLSRCAILWLGFVAPAAREGMGAWLCESKDWETRIFSVLWAAGALWIVPTEGQAILLLLGLLILIGLARQYFVKRLGGVVGDCFGAFQQVTVIYCLYLFAWPTT